jgi:hypothetical protein
LSGNFARNHCQACEQAATGLGAVMNTVMPGGPPAPGGAPVDAVVLRMLLGTQLRRLREAAGITPEQAGTRIRGSR